MSVCYYLSMKTSRHQHRIDVDMTLEMIEKGLADLKALGRVSQITLEGRLPTLYARFDCDPVDFPEIQNCLNRLVHDIRFPKVD